LSLDTSRITGSGVFHVSAQVTGTHTCGRRALFSGAADNRSIALETEIHVTVADEPPVDLDAVVDRLTADSK
jgi:hypothetical protein